MQSVKRRNPGVCLYRHLAVVAVPLLLALMLWVPASRAQSAEPAPAAAETEAVPATSAEIDALVAALEDPEQRARLIEQLKLLKTAPGDGDGAEAAEAPPPEPLVADGLGARLLAALSDQVEEISDGLAAAGAVILALPRTVAGLVAEAGEPAARQRWLEIAARLVLVVGAGLLAYWAVGRLLQRAIRAIEARSAESPWVKLPMLLVRLVLALLPLAAFAAATYLVLPLTEPRPQTAVVAVILVNAMIAARAVRAVAAVLLAPAAPQLRLLWMGDETANYAYIWISRLTTVLVYGYFLAQAALLLGLAPAAYALLLRAVGLVVAVLLVVLVLQNRDVVAAWLRGRPPAAEPATAGDGNGADAPTGFRRLRRGVAEIWHVLAIVYIAATYVVWALDMPGGFAFLLRATALTAVVLALLRLLIAILHRVVQRGFALSVEVRQRHPGLEARVNRYLPVFERVIQVVLYVLAALWLLEIWGIDSFDWIGSDIGSELTASVLSIAVIVLAALLLLEVMDVVFERYLAPRDALGNPVLRSARARTLLPLLRNAMRVLVAVMVVLVVLSEIGVNIAPLLAGAGVVGLAIGFGAQTLVKDIITGFFILAEEQISVGDIVDLGGNAGVVEAMTIRTIRLRDASGSVYMIPFSAVTTVKNFSKEFAYAKIDLRVAYANDMDAVVAMMREVADSMRADEAFRNAILSDLEVWGLDAFDEAAFTIVARLKTIPNNQWAVTREFRRRLKELFDARGIQFPFPKRIIHMAPGTQRLPGTGAPGAGGFENADGDDESSPAR